MNFIKALLVWAVMAIVIATGVVMAAKGSFWLLAVSVLAFVVMVGKIGCMTH